MAPGAVGSCDEARGPGVLPHDNTDNRARIHPLRDRREVILGHDRGHVARHRHRTAGRLIRPYDLHDHFARGVLHGDQQPQDLHRSGLRQPLQLLPHLAGEVLAIRGEFDHQVLDRSGLILGVDLGLRHRGLPSANGGTPPGYRSWKSGDFGRRLHPLRLHGTGSRPVPSVPRPARAAEHALAPLGAPGGGRCRRLPTPTTSPQRAAARPPRHWLRRALPHGVHDCQL